MRRTPIVAVAMATTMLAPATGAAQQTPVAHLERPGAVASQPLSSVSGLRELPDGTVLVSDAREGVVRMISLTTGRAERVGRTGRGPGEYTRPDALYPVAGDTTLLLDLTGRRLLMIGPGGQFTDRVTQLGMVGGGFKPPRGIDEQGRLYMDLAGILTSATAEGAARGVAPVLRWRPGTQLVETVVEIHVPPVRMGEMRSGPLPPYQARDEWAVDREGRVAVVRQTPYRVEWHLPDRPAPILGPTVSYRPVPVGDAEKAAWIERLSGAGLVTVTQGGQRRTLRTPVPDAGDLQWPAVLPAFEGRPWIDPTGRIWVKRSRPARTAEVLYDVFDEGGRLLTQVELPAGRALVGFGRGALYAGREDENGLLWLERYPMPGP